MKTAVYSIRIAGNDVSSNFAPFLLKLTTVDKVGTSTDTCNIHLDDKDARIFFPKAGDPLQVLLGWSDEGLAVVFDGTIDEIHALASRHEGRTVEISAKGFDTKGKAKHHRQKHYDNKSVQDILSDAGKFAGINSVTVAPSLASIVLDYESQNDESFIHFGSRIAHDIGGQFKIVGSKAIITEVGAGTSVTGQALPGIKATWGDNLHSYSISPELSRHLHKTARSRWYDKDKAEWNEETEDTGDEGAEATKTHRHTHHNKDHAKKHAIGSSKLAKKDKGGGYVEIEGTTAAQPEGTCTVNARPGIDGTYMIETVQQILDRSGGWITRLDFKKPGGDAGKDTRKTKKSK